MSSLVINAVGDGKNAGFDIIQNRIETLSSKMDKLINIQEKVLSRLDGMSHDIDDIEKDMENLKVDKEEIHLPPRVMNQTQVMGREVRQICQEMSSIMLVVNQRSEQQAQKLEGMEKLVLSMQQVISFIGETVKHSKIMELMLKGPAAQKGSRSKDSKGKQAIKRKSSSDTVSKKPDKKTTSNKGKKGKQEITPACEPSTLQSSPKIKLHGPKHFLASRKCGNFLKDHKGKDGTDTPRLSPKGLKAQKKMKPPDTAEHISLKKQILLLEEVQKLNRENAEKSGQQITLGFRDLEAGVPPKDKEPDASASSLVDYLQEDSQVDIAEKNEDVEAVTEEESGEKVPEDVTEKELKPSVENLGKQEEEEKLEVQEDKEEKGVSAAEEDSGLPSSPDNKKEATPIRDDHKDAAPSPEAEQESISEVSSTKSFVTQEHFIVEEHPKSQVLEKKVEEEEENKNKDEKKVDESEGWGVFKADGIELQLNLKQQLEKEREKDDAEKEDDDDPEQYFIDTTPPPVAPFNHRIVSAKPNLITNFYTISWQEILGGVAGGELFDRIIDENYTLMELDAVVFIRQICEGLQHMHKMSILHLDLKPENILCVSRITNKVKIIDFGLARIYKPREKLRVNFGTPEFLAPEVINYDFVSFNTDMWSLGVITYMLMSGLCPFLGDDDNETLNNILACQWNFEEQEFVDTSEEAKDFISRLLIVNKSWRMGACEALRHPWLADPALHHRLHTKKTMCRSRRSSCVPNTES
ncbi:unnamed protein product [Oreochromis niloticus]|nr:unnamed protein product [Mustela putorius furo]